jgi:hypothetical protein
LKNCILQNNGFIFIFAGEEIASFLSNFRATVGHKSYSTSAVTSYYLCQVGRCSKKYRVVKSLLPEDPDIDWQIDGLFVEEAADEALDHFAMGVNLRGLSESQKEIVIQ